MRISLCLLILFSSLVVISAQDLEISGKVNIGTMIEDNEADSVVVRQSDGTLGLRGVSTLGELQILSISNDTIYLTGGGYVRLPMDKVADGDSSSTNELQSISLMSDSLTLSDGGGKVRIDTSNTNEKITGFGIVGDSLYIKEGSMDTMKVALPISLWYMGQDTLGGIVFSIYKGQDGLDHGLIVDNMETTALWQNTGTSTGANRTWDGGYNTNKMTDSPAATYVSGRSTNLPGDWYLPSIDELSQLWHNRIYVNKALNEGNHTLLSTVLDYWSSTEYSASATSAWAFTFRNGYTDYVNKRGTLSVRAIRAF